MLREAKAQINFKEMSYLKRFLLTVIISVFVGISYGQGDSTTTVEKPRKEQRGKASFYGNKYSRKRKTASGEHFVKEELTAAHRTLPFNTKVKVTNVKNGKSVIVRINDRGPFLKERILDLSPAAFDSIASRKTGVINVVAEII